MLKIRNEQMQILEEIYVGKFLKETAESIRARLPNYCEDLPEPLLLGRLREGLATAQAYGIVEPEDIAAYLDLVVVHGARFAELDSFGWAEPILTDESVGGDLKIAMLLERMPDALRPRSDDGTLEGSR